MVGLGLQPGRVTVTPGHRGHGWGIILPARRSSPRGAVRGLVAGRGGFGDGVAAAEVAGDQLARRAREVATRVRSEFLHAWTNYEKYAWGHDALRPLSKTPRDWYGVSLCMTPVDAFDTMVLMGLKEEAAEAKRLILDSLSFDQDVEVQSFEITIRLLGGLLSAYQLDGDRRFLDLAVRTYSTGMLMRLAFAITTSVTSEILIMDEFIGTGDAASGEDAMKCERCGHEMYRMHAVWRCPSCRFKTDCCGW